MHITKKSTQSTQFHTQGNRDPVSTTLEFTLGLKEAKDMVEAWMAAR